jgi:hypothetical protein
MSLSLMLRLCAVLLVMYLLFADSWQQLLSAVLGMLITRSLLVKRIEPKPNSDQNHGDKTQRTAA